MSRFFKADKNLIDLEDHEIKKFLQKEGLINNVSVERVHDFYRALSNLGSLETEDNINYDLFNCKTSEDRQAINKLRDMEKDYLGNINPSKEMQGQRLLKAATALSYKFEQLMAEGAEPGDSDPNSYLKNIMDYCDTAEAQKLTFAEMLDLDLDYLKYIALLSSKKAFQGQSTILEKSEDGKKIKYTAMESVSEVVNSDKTNFVMPGFTRKLLEKDIYVRSRFAPKKKSQNLIILVDNSGSMSSGYKPSMLKAAITLKIKDVSDVNNIYIGTFITSVFGYHKVLPGERFEDFKFITLSGGGTNVNGCVKDTLRLIKERKLPSYQGEIHQLSDSHFEILVINDGEDDVDKSFHPDIKLHALCLMQSNPDLKNICIRSGGTYFNLKS